MIEGERKHLAEAIDTLRAQGLHPDTRVLWGVPFLEITRQVLRGGHDLVIVSAEGNCGIREPLTESPALHLMRTCPCPLWVLRSARGEPRSGILAALDAEAGEHEDLNLKILDFAYCLAQWENGEIHVLHPRPTGEENLPRHYASVGQSSCQQSPVEKCFQDQKRLDSRCAEYRPVSRRMHFYYLRGEAAPRICRLAHDRQVDIIVMGTACRPGTKEYVLGNIAETVLHQVGCSVLSVKPDSFVSPVAA